MRHQGNEVSIKGIPILKAYLCVRNLFIRKIFCYVQLLELSFFLILLQPMQIHKLLKLLMNLSWMGEKKRLLIMFLSAIRKLEYLQLTKQLPQLQTQQYTQNQLLFLYQKVGTFTLKELMRIQYTKV